MPIQRTTILRGPAKITFNGASFFSKDDISVGIEPATFEIGTSAHGIVDERFLEAVPTIQFTPCGEWENIATLWPYGSHKYGQTIFGADLPLVITSIVDGQTLTAKAAAVTTPPDMIFSASKTLWGPVTFSSLRSDNVAYSVDESLLADAAGSYSDTTFDPASIITQPYALAWGSSPWNAFGTQDGIVVSSRLALTPISVDADGVVDMMFSGQTVLARCIPVAAAGLSVDNVLDALKIQGSGVARGGSLSSRSNTADLTITGSGVFANLKQAAMKTGGFKFGATVFRIGEVGFVATRTFSSGTANPLFRAGTSSPGTVLA